MAREDPLDVPEPWRTCQVCGGRFLRSLRLERVARAFCWECLDALEHGQTPPRACGDWALRVRAICREVDVRV